MTPRAEAGEKGDGMTVDDLTNGALSDFWDRAPEDEPSVPESAWHHLPMCPTCGCCSIGRMGTCVGGCGPRGGRSRHDQAALR